MDTQQPVMETSAMQLNVAEQIQGRRAQAERLMADARRMAREAQRLIDEANLFESIVREGYQIVKPQIPSPPTPSVGGVGS